MLRETVKERWKYSIREIKEESNAEESIKAQKKNRNLNSATCDSDSDNDTCEPEKNEENVN